MATIRFRWQHNGPDALEAAMAHLESERPGVRSLSALRIGPIDPDGWMTVEVTFAR